MSRCPSFLLQCELQSGMEQRMVAAGPDRSFFVDANGALLACGAQKEPDPLDSQEGTSQTSTAVAPRPVPCMAGVRVRSVVCQSHCSLALSEAGQVFAWGCGEGPADTVWSLGRALEPTLVPALSNQRVRQLAAGELHCAAVTEDGALFTWATGKQRRHMVGEPRPELGHGYKVHKFCVPHRVLAFKGMRITSVAVGDDFTVAVTEAGEVYSFGCGDWWLGHGTGDENFDEETEEFEGVFLPERIKALDGIPVATVAAADYHTLVLTRCGRVYTWGAMDIDSLVHGRGKEDGNLNELDAEDINFNVPQLMTALLGKRVRSIAAGPEMSCAVTDAGGLYTWGQDACGCLGHGDGWQGVSRPTLVRGLDGIRVVGVSTDEQHTLALAADGSVYAFGEGPGLGLSLVSEGEKMVARTLTPQKNPNLKCMVPP